MTPFRTLLVALAAFLLAIGLLACSSSDDPASPGGETGPDTTAPQVAGTDPGNGSAGVAQGQEITITFSEAMDPATSDGNVTLSAGSVTSAIWTDTRTLQVTHSTWDEGAHVTVTLGAGLADAAGNNLASAYSFSFYVYSPTLQVLETQPADGDEGVNRDSNVQILFSTEINESTAADHIVIADGSRTVYPFTVHRDNSAVTLEITDRLPAATEITVTVGAQVAAQSGGTLGTDHVFSFTTGADVDETPPTVVSSYPAIGATVAADVGYFQVTFSEPMNPNSFEPRAWNVEFALVIMASEPDPTWSNNYMTVTVPLPSPLPAGLPMEITFADLEDAHGVVMTSPWTWEATVSGTADYYPVTDGLEAEFATSWADGLIGNTEPEYEGDGSEYLKIEDQGDGTFHLTRYESGFSGPPRDYEVYRKLSDQLQWLGFSENDGMGGMEEMTFSTPAKVLPLPLATGTWTANTTVTIPDQGTFTATLHGTVVGRYDLAIDDQGSSPEMFFKDTWKVIRRLEVQFEGELAMVDTDTTWYSPTLGPVRIFEMDESAMDGEWYYSQMWRMFGDR